MNCKATFGTCLNRRPMIVLALELLKERIRLTRLSVRQKG